MYQYDDPTAVSQMPPPGAAGTAGYFTDGNPASGQPATLLRADFMNTLMMELVNAIQAGGLVPTKGKNNQLAQVLGGLAPVGINVQFIQKSGPVKLPAHSFFEFNGTVDCTATLPDPTQSIPVLAYFWNGSTSNQLTLATAVGAFFGQGIPANGATFNLPPGYGALVCGDTHNYIVLLSCYSKNPPVGDSSNLNTTTNWTQNTLSAAISALNLGQYATSNALATAIAGLNIGQYATSNALAAAVAPLAPAARIGSNGGVSLYQAAATQPLTDIGKLVELSGTFTLATPNLNGAPLGAVMEYINTGAGSVTIQATGTAFFYNGVTTPTVLVSPGVSIRAVFDGVNLVVTGGFGGAGLAPNGYQRLPSGLIIQWGSSQFSASGSATMSITLPMAFPNNNFQGFASDVGGGAYPYGCSPNGLTKINVYQAAWVAFGSNNNAQAVNGAFRWFAIGN
ncbi:gp53-like domain-containing protein [Chromobacterium vaccinii]|uniref:gp53-like domain-containing protein n=1 Tax=Chromobacterium vaccinii TaxID=1108595 RepID=UPI003C727E4D